MHFFHLLILWMSSRVFIYWGFGVGIELSIMEPEVVFVEDFVLLLEDLDLD